MSDHIKNLYIKSFRGIESLKLENLSQINILTGDNNCGKTSVLEVIESFKSPSDFRTWVHLLRKETGIKVYPGYFSYFEGVLDLFNVNESERVLEYIVTTDTESVNVRLTAIESEESMSQEKYADLMNLRTSKESDKYFMADNLLIVPKLDLEIMINDEKICSESFYEGENFLNNILKEKKAVSKSLDRNIVSISPVSHTEKNMFLSEILDKPALYEEMLEVLKDYDNDIISINYDRVGRPYAAHGIYKILSKSCDRALPINVYGDGMKKAILLMSAVIKAQNEILLVDEFETAIHTSAMDRTFRWILETCLRLNVQLFLTSHSKEAIDKLLKCAPDISDKIALYTLYKDKDGASVRRLNGKKAIEVQDEMGLELR